MRYIDENGIQHGEQHTSLITPRDGFMGFMAVL